VRERAFSKQHSHNVGLDLGDVMVGNINFFSFFDFCGFWSVAVNMTNCCLKNIFCFKR